MSILIPTPVPSPPYPIVNDALNLARTRINDAIASIGGDILTNTQPFTQVMTNAAWLKLQQFLAQLGFSRNRKRTVLTGFPVVGSSDPASECRLNWSSFYDGVSYWIPPNAPVLPPDFVAPLRISERQSTGYQATLTTSMAQFSPLRLMPDGNPDWTKRGYNGWFDWRYDDIILPGSTSIMDLEIFYAALLPYFNTIADVQWYEQPIPILRSESALANYICAEFANGRGDMDARQYVTDAQDDARQLYNNADVPLKQRNSVSRRAYSGHRAGRTSFDF